MSLYNMNAGYGSLVARSLIRPTAGKTFFVTDAIGTGTTAQFLQDVFTPDSDGVARVYSSITLALAACVTGRADVIVIAADYTTAPTDVELASAGTKGVEIVFSDRDDSEQIAMTTSKALPATATGSIFTVTGLVEVIAIVGVVTTVIQTQACNLKLATVSNAATTDISADLNISAHAAQSRYSITGTFANATINTAKGVPVARQATPIIVQEGTIAAITSATNTGNVRWMVRYRPLQQGARIVAA
jgi:hypothetical protein